MPDHAVPFSPGEPHADDALVRVRLPITLLTRAATAEGDERSLLDLARERAPDPSIFEEHPPVFFDVRASDSTLDFYYTRMMPSTLKNYAEDASIDGGVPFLDTHRSGTIKSTLGRTLRGVYTRGSGDRPHRVVVTNFSQPTLSEDQRLYVDLLRSGQARDVSVGFTGGRMECSICGGEMLRWYRAAPGDKPCYHLPGVQYAVVDSSGTETGDRVMAEGLIEDAHLGELSGVPQGANKNAEFLGFKKARQLEQEGLLTPEARWAVERATGLVVPPRPRLFLGVDAPDRAVTTQEDTMPEPNTAPTPDEIARARDAERGHWHDQIALSLRIAGIEVNQGDDLLMLVRSLAEEIVKSRPAAEDGRKWKATLVTAAVEEGIRAFGDDFAQERQRARLERMDPEDIQLETSSWAAIAARSLPPGRATTDETPAPETPAQPTGPRALPNDAYRTTGRRAG